jgi:hypothetical protein
MIVLLSRSYDSHGAREVARIAELSVAENSLLF